MKRTRLIFLLVLTLLGIATPGAHADDSVFSGCPNTWQVSLPPLEISLNQTFHQANPFFQYFDSSYGFGFVDGLGTQIKTWNSKLFNTLESLGAHKIGSMQHVLYESGYEYSLDGINWVKPKINGWEQYFSGSPFLMASQGFGNGVYWRFAIQVQEEGCGGITDFGTNPVKINGIDYTPHTFEDWVTKDAVLHPGLGVNISLNFLDLGNLKNYYTNLIKTLSDNHFYSGNDFIMPSAPENTFPNPRDYLSLIPINPPLCATFNEDGYYHLKVKSFPCEIGLVGVTQSDALGAKRGLENLPTNWTSDLILLNKFIISSSAAKVSTLKKTTITCIKGKLTKTVTAVKPVCPAGYKKK